MNWKFGLIESICVIVFIGISVDYVSHFSHMFQHSNSKNRKEKTEYAFNQMGPTILGGALTSCFSGFFLICSGLQFEVIDPKLTELRLLLSESLP